MTILIVEKDCPLMMCIFLLLLLVNTNKNKIRKSHTSLGSTSLLHTMTIGSQVLFYTFTLSLLVSKLLTNLYNLLRTIETKDFAPHMIGLVLGTTLIIEVICWGLRVAQIFNYFLVKSSEVILATGYLLMQVTC